MSIQLTFLKCTLKNRLYYVFFYHDLKKEQWDGKIEADSFVEQLYQSWAAHLQTFCYVKKIKPWLSSFFKKVDDGFSKPTDSQDHQDPPSTDTKIWVPIYPFILRSFSQSGPFSVSEVWCSSVSQTHLLYYLLQQTFLVLVFGTILPFLVPIFLTVFSSFYLVLKQDRKIGVDLFSPITL